MPQWRVDISYWGGFTPDLDWEDRVRAVFEARGWSEITFGNCHHDDYIPSSTDVDADEISFAAESEKPDPESVKELLKQLGVQRCYVSIDEYKAT